MTSHVLFIIVTTLYWNNYNTRLDNTYLHECWWTQWFMNMQPMNAMGFLYLYYKEKHSIQPNPEKQTCLPFSMYTYTSTFNQKPNFPLTYVFFVTLNAFKGVFDVVHRFSRWPINILKQKEDDSKNMMCQTLLNVYTR